MSTRSAEKDKPKRPLNGYFRFRVERLKTYDEDDNNKSKKVKIEWDELTQDEKEKYNKAYRKEKEAYDEEMAEWNKRHGIKSKSKKKEDKKRNRSRSRSEKKNKEKENDKKKNK